MGNRFSTVPQYHQLVTGHGILAAIVFLFLVPAAVMHARFHGQPLGTRPNRRIHIFLQIISVFLLTAVFVLGWFAVGPNRSWTNPHHVIGLALYVMFLVQAVGGRLVKNIHKRSLRLTIHRWHGRAIALLGIAQVPLGLTLYGSPKVTFILYAIWMGFLFLTYFVLSYRHESQREDYLIHGGRSEGGLTSSAPTEKHKGGWLGPLALGAGALALFRGRNKDNKDRSESGSRSRSVSRSRRGPPEVVPSRGGSASYFDEKYSDRTEAQRGGLADKLLGVAAALGAGAFVKNIRDRREKRRFADEEYSAVATDTPSRVRRQHRDDYTESELSEDRTALGGRGRAASSMVSGPTDRVAAAHALSAAEPRSNRPVTPPAARPAASRVTSYFQSDYFDDYDSPSRRPKDEDRGVAKGILGTLGLGWFADKLKGRRDKKAEEERLKQEERRDARDGSAYTEGYSTPPRQTRRRPPPSASDLTRTSLTQDSGSSQLESRPAGTSHSGPPMPPLGAGAGAGAGPAPPPPPPGPVPDFSRSRPRPRNNGVPGPVAGSEAESYMSAGGNPRRRQSSSRRRDGEVAAAAAAATAHHLAQEQEEERRRTHGTAPGQPVSVKVKYHDDRGNVTLRRLTEEEAAAARQDRRRRSGSVSSLSGSETPGQRRRYRRSSDSQATERPDQSMLSPPTPTFAKGHRQKDSAYYSGQPGPSGSIPAPAQTVSSIGSPESHGTHGTWSALSPSLSGPVNDRPAPSVATSAADRRRRRRIERQAGRPSGASVSTDYN